MSHFVRRAEQLQGKRIEALHGPVRLSAAHLSDWIGRRSQRRQEESRQSKVLLRRIQMFTDKRERTGYAPRRVARSGAVSPP